MTENQTIERKPLSPEKERIRALITELEPLLHKEYGTNMLHDVSVITKFAELNMWKNLADLNHDAIEDFKKKMEAAKQEAEEKAKLNVVTPPNIDGPNTGKEIVDGQES